MGLQSPELRTEGAAIAYAPTHDPAPPVATPAPGFQGLPPRLNTRDAARYLGMSESWLRQSRMAGRMSLPPPWHVIGTWAVRYFQHELDSWLAHRAPCGDQRKAASEAPAPEPSGPRRQPG